MDSIALISAHQCAKDLHMHDMFRLSTRGRLSLGDSMLRSVDANMDPMAMSKVMEVRHEEQVALQVQSPTPQRPGT